MVVFIHSFNLDLKSNILIVSGYSLFIQLFLCEGIFRIAVPLFFSISGYLFFHNFTPIKSVFFLKIKRRFNTLFIPYVLWSLWGLFIYFIMQMTPGSNSFFTHKLIREFSIVEIFNTVFLHPIPYQLWFIRDLIVIIVISPVLYWLIRYLKYFTIFFFLFTWFGKYNFVIFSNEALLFFVFGSFLSINNIEFIKNKSTNKTWIKSLLWLVFVLCYTILIYSKTGYHFFNSIILKASILVGIIAFWNLLDSLWVNKTLIKSKFYNLFSFSFFLYAFHEPILTIIKKVLFFILGNNEIVSLIVFFTAPMLTISISIVTGFYLRLFMPKFYGIITGGR